MNRQRKITGILAAALVAGAIGTGVATAAGGDDDGTNVSISGDKLEKSSAASADDDGGAGDDDATDVSIPGTALEKASAAALEYTGEGRVTETEVGDEESYYEVEVTLDNGSQVDVQLNRTFKVVGSEDDDDGAGDDE